MSEFDDVPDGKTNGKVYETTRMFIWDVETSEFVEGKAVTSPRFSTILGSAISNWFLRCRCKDPDVPRDYRGRMGIPPHDVAVHSYREKRQEELCTSISLYHSGPREFDADIRFSVFDGDGEKMDEANLFYQRISRTHVTDIYVQDITKTVIGDPSFGIGCEIKFEPRNYHNRSMERLQLPTDLRLLEFDKFENLIGETNLADVKFKVDGDSRDPIPAHRIILSAMSPVFRAMFAHDMQERRASLIEITDVPYDAFLIMLRYLYTAKLEENLSVNALSEVLVAATIYLVPGLKTRCEKALIELLDSENALKLLSMADTYNALELRASSMSCIIINSRSIVRSDDFYQNYENLPKRILCDLFQSLATFRRDRRL